jgi:L-rhamnose mutarotase
VTAWSIWRSGRDLFHLVEVEDYAAMRHALADDPVNVAWQQQMSELLEVADDYSGDDRGIPLVWSLP